MIINDKNYVRLDHYIASGRSYYSNIQVLRRAIRSEGFPAIKVGKFLFVNPEDADLHIKRTKLSKTVRAS